LATIGGIFHAGAVYVYSKVGMTWQRPDILAQPYPAEGDQFGQAASLSGDGKVALAGAPIRTVDNHRGAGAVYLFSRGSAGWTNSATYDLGSRASDGQQLGMVTTLSANGNTALISAWLVNAVIGLDIRNGKIAGSSLFTRNDRSFGYSLALTARGDHAVVGATSLPAPHLYYHIGKAWKVKLALKPNDNGFGDPASIDSDGHMCLVGLGQKGGALVYNLP
jgi:hypothetical protein